MPVRNTTRRKTTKYGKKPAPVRASRYGNPIGQAYAPGIGIRKAGRKGTRYGSLSRRQVGGTKGKPLRNYGERGPGFVHGGGQRLGFNIFGQRL